MLYLFRALLCAPFALFVTSVTVHAGCELYQTEGNSPQQRLRFDLTQPITDADVILLEDSLDAERPTWATGGNYAPREAHVFLGIVLLTDLGPVFDASRGATLLDEARAFPGGAFFNVINLPGASYFSDLGFRPNVDIALLSELLQERAQNGGVAFAGGAFDRQMLIVAQRGAGLPSSMQFARPTRIYPPIRPWNGAPGSKPSDLSGAASRRRSSFWLNWRVTLTPRHWSTLLVPVCPTHWRIWAAPSSKDARRPAARARRLKRLTP